MDTIRFINSFIAALFLSGLAWLIGGEIFPDLNHGGGLLSWISTGDFWFVTLKAPTRGHFFDPPCTVAPVALAIISAFTAMVFVFSGTLVAPSRTRKSAFLFFGLSFLFSTGLWACGHFSKIGDLNHWIASVTGIIIGSSIGLYFSLKLQDRRSKTEPKEYSFRGKLSVFFICLAVIFMGAAWWLGLMTYRVGDTLPQNWLSIKKGMDTDEIVNIAVGTGNESVIGHYTDKTDSLLNRIHLPHADGAWLLTVTYDENFKTDHATLRYSGDFQTLIRLLPYPKRIE